MTAAAVFLLLFGWLLAATADSRRIVGIRALLIMACAAVAAGLVLRVLWVYAP